MSGSVNIEKELLVAGMALTQLGEAKVQFVNGLFAEAKNGDKEKLGEALHTLKAGLFLEKEGLSLADVMEGEDFIPVLVQGLKSDEFQVQLNASWVVCEILLEGTPAQKEKAVRGEGTAIYPALLKMLASPEPNVWQSSLHTLANMLCGETGSGGDVDAEKTDDLAQLVNMAQVVSVYAQGHRLGNGHPPSLELERFFKLLLKAVVEGDAGLKNGLIKGMLECGFIHSLVKCLDEVKTPKPYPVLAVTILAVIFMEGSELEELRRVMIEEEAVPLLKKLLSSGEKEVRWGAVCCLWKLMIMSEPKVRDELLEFGILGKLKGMLGRESDSDRVSFLILVFFDNLLVTEPRVGLDKLEGLTECLGTFLDVEMIRRLKKVEGAKMVAQGLLQVFLCFGHLADYGEEGLALLEKKGLLKKSLQLLRGEQDLENILVYTMLHSGFVGYLVKCVKKKEETSFANAILSKLQLLSRMGPHKLNRVYFSPLPVQFLSSGEELVRALAVYYLGRAGLIKSGPKARRELKRLGGIDKLIKVLEEQDRKDAVRVGSILICIEDWLPIKLKVGLDKWGKLPSSLKKLMELEDGVEGYGRDYMEEVLIRVFRCVDYLAANGEPGRKLLEKGGLLGMIGIIPDDLDQLLEGLSFRQRDTLKLIVGKEPPSFAEIFKAIKGSADPLKALNVQISKVFSRQMICEMESG